MRLEQASGGIESLDPTLIQILMRCQKKTGPFWLIIAFIYSSIKISTFNIS